MQQQPRWLMKKFPRTGARGRFTWKNNNQQLTPINAGKYNSVANMGDMCSNRYPAFKFILVHESTKKNWSHRKTWNKLQCKNKNISCNKMIWGLLPDRTFHNSRASKSILNFIKLVDPRFWGSNNMKYSVGMGAGAWLLLPNELKQIGRQTARHPAKKEAEAVSFAGNFILLS